MSCSELMESYGGAAALDWRWLMIRNCKCLSMPAARSRATSLTVSSLDLTLSWSHDNCTLTCLSLPRVWPLKMPRVALASVWTRAR